MSKASPPHTTTRVAEGTPVNLATPVDGVLMAVADADATLALLDKIEAGTVKDPIVMVHEAGGTTIGPLLGHIRGVVSTEGGVGSHIAILAKEFDCACIVAARVIGELTLPARVLLAPDGTISLIGKE